ncbi:MAG TPA: hypothetical protein VGD88_01040 [Opitutaceae bacterium]
MMPSRQLLLMVLLLGVGLSGCTSSGKLPESATSAAALEEAFKERWVTKRVGELLLAGTATDGIQARRMALSEFRDKFEYIRGVERR